MLRFDCDSSEFSNSVNELLLGGATVPVYVSGNSMNPFLVSRRDIVWLKAFDESDLKIGKIVLFRRKDGSLVLHRIKKIISDVSFIVMGDAQTWYEEVDINSVVAVVTALQRKGKIRSDDSFYWRMTNTVWRLLFPFRTVIMRIWFKIKK